MIETFEYRGWSHELTFVSQSTAPGLAERLGGDVWHDNLDRPIGVKFRYNKLKGHYTEYAKFGHWIAIQTSKETGEQITQVLNEAHVNHLMRSAGVGQKHRVPNRPRGGD